MGPHSQQATAKKVIKVGGNGRKTYSSAKRAIGQESTNQPSNNGGNEGIGDMKIMAVGISQNFSCEMNSFLTTHCEWVNGFLNRCFLC